MTNKHKQKTLWTFVSIFIVIQAVFVWFALHRRGYTQRELKRQNDILRREFDELKGKYSLESIPRPVRNEVLLRFRI